MLLLISHIKIFTFNAIYSVFAVSEKANDIFILFKNYTITIIFVNSLIHINPIIKIILLLSFKLLINNYLILLYMTELILLIKLYLYI